MQRIVALIVSIAAFTTTLPAQSVDPGQRVRIKSPLVQGEFVIRSLAADSIVLEDRSGNAVHTIARSSINRMEVYAGRRSAGNRLIRGMGYGALIGGVPLAVLMYADGDALRCEPPSGAFFYFCAEPTAEEKAAIGFIAGAVLGSVIGGVFGLARSGERWQRLPLERVVATQSGNGFTAGLSLSF